MTKAIEMIKNIIESYLWYDGEVYPIVDDTNQVSYATTGLRMGNYSGNINWLKIISTYAYKDYTLTLLPGASLTLVENTETKTVVLTYVDTSTTQNEILTKIEEWAGFVSGTVSNSSIAITQDSDVGIFHGGKFVVKRKEGGHVGMDVDQAELYNIKCESDNEENVKAMITNLRLLSNNINFFSYKWTTSGYPFSLKFGDADDKQNIGNNEFIITISLQAVSTL